MQILGNTVDFQMNIIKCHNKVLIPWPCRQKTVLSHYHGFDIFSAEAINISDSEGLTEIHCRHTGFI